MSRQYFIFYSGKLLEYIFFKVIRVNKNTLFCVVFWSSPQTSPVCQWFAPHSSWSAQCARWPSPSSALTVRKPTSAVLVSRLFMSPICSYWVGSLCIFLVRVSSSYLSKRGTLYANTRPLLHPRIHLLHGKLVTADRNGGHREWRQQATGQRQRFTPSLPMWFLGVSRYLCRKSTI